MCKACPIVLSKPSQQCGGNIYLPTGEEMHLEKVNDLLKVAGDFTGIWAPGFHQGCPLHVPPAIRAGIQKEGGQELWQNGTQMQRLPLCRPITLSWSPQPPGKEEGSHWPLLAWTGMSLNMHVFWAYVGQFLQSDSFLCSPLLSTKKRSWLPVGSLSLQLRSALRGLCSVTGESSSHYISLPLKLSICSSCPPYVWCIMNIPSHLVIQIVCGYYQFSFPCGGDWA